MSLPLHRRDEKTEPVGLCHLAGGHQQGRSKPTTASITITAASDQNAAKYNIHSQSTLSSLDRGAGAHACYLKTYSVSSCLIAVHGVTKHG